ADLEVDRIEPFEREDQHDEERETHAAEQPSGDRGRVDHHEPKQPIEHEREKPRREAGGPQLQQDAFRRLGGDDGVYVTRHERRPLEPRAHSNSIAGAGDSTGARNVSYVWRAKPTPASV